MDVELAINKRVGIPAGGDAQASFYFTIAGTDTDALANGDTARAHTGTNGSTAPPWQHELAELRRPSDLGLQRQRTFNRVRPGSHAIKQSQSPVLWECGR